MFARLYGKEKGLDENSFMMAGQVFVPGSRGLPSIWIGDRHDDGRLLGNVSIIRKLSSENLQVRNVDFLLPDLQQAHATVHKG